MLLNSKNYLTVTDAPTSSSLAFNSSASSLDTPSLTGAGAPSTTALASFKPKPVASRTALITLTFWSPAAVNSTVNSVCSSAAAAPPAAATATGAAADTPNSSSIALTRSLSSRIVASFNSATMF